jgi:protein ImuA
MNTAIESLLKHPQIWRGKRTTWTDTYSIATGFADLDAQLPGGGWPRGALTEVFLPQPGIGELRLLLPALARLNGEKKWIALIAPPYIPYAPAWQTHGVDISRLLWVHPRDATDHLWATEQSLRAGTCSAVLCWPTVSPTFQQLRRLQLAAETGRSWGIVFRPSPSAIHATPAAVRIQLDPQDKGLSVHLLKRRGAWGGEAVQLSLPLLAAIQ